MQTDRVTERQLVKGVVGCVLLLAASTIVLYTSHPGLHERSIVPSGVSLAVGTVMGIVLAPTGYRKSTSTGRGRNVVIIGMVVVALVAKAALDSLVGDWTPVIFGCLATILFTWLVVGALVYLVTSRR